MNLTTFKTQIAKSPESIEFNDTMAIIDELYNFTPCEFKNGDTINAENQNNGSCKLFAFALDQNLNKKDTLACFGSFYRVDVLENPEGDDHQNIRNFMQYGWDGLEFKGAALTKK